MHQGRSDEAEIPIVHLFTEVGHHDDEKNGLVRTCDRQTVEVVVADFLRGGGTHGIFLPSCVWPGTKGNSNGRRETFFLVKSA